MRPLALFIFTILGLTLLATGIYMTGSFSAVLRLSAGDWIVLLGLGTLVAVITTPLSKE